MIIETEEHVLARGAKPIARLLGAGITSDGNHMVSPDVEGGGAARAMKRAMETAGLSRSDNEFINAHATATPIGDAAEAKAISAVVGTDAAIYAPKGARGHSIGAVGALEAALTVLSIRDGIIPPTLNLDNQDPEIELDRGPRCHPYERHLLRAEQLLRIRRPQRGAGVRQVLSSTPEAGRGGTPRRPGSHVPDGGGPAPSAITS